MFSDVPRRHPVSTTPHRSQTTPNCHFRSTRLVLPSCDAANAARCVFQPPGFTRCFPSAGVSGGFSNRRSFRGVFHPPGFPGGFPIAGVFRGVFQSPGFPGCFPTTGFFGRPNHEGKPRGCLRRPELRPICSGAQGIPARRWFRRVGVIPPPTTDRRPPTTDRRPPTTDRRLPTTDHRPPTTDRRPPNTHVPCALAGRAPTHDPSPSTCSAWRTLRRNSGGASASMSRS